LEFDEIVTTRRGIHKARIALKYRSRVLYEGGFLMKNFYEEWNADDADFL